MSQKTKNKAKSKKQEETIIEEQKPRTKKQEELVKLYSEAYEKQFGKPISKKDIKETKKAEKEMEKSQKEYQKSLEENKKAEELAQKLEKAEKENPKSKKESKAEYHKRMIKQIELQSIIKPTEYKQKQEILAKAQPHIEALQQELKTKNTGKLYSTKALINIRKNPDNVAKELAECKCNETFKAKNECDLCKEGVTEYFEEKKKRK